MHARTHAHTHTHTTGEATGTSWSGFIRVSRWRVPGSTGQYSWRTKGYCKRHRNDKNDTPYQRSSTEAHSYSKEQVCVYWLDTPLYWVSLFYSIPVVCVCGSMCANHVKVPEYQTMWIYPSTSSTKPFKPCEYRNSLQVSCPKSEMYPDTFVVCTCVYRTFYTKIGLLYIQYSSAKPFGRDK